MLLKWSPGIETLTIRNPKWVFPGSIGFLSCLVRAIKTDYHTHLVWLWRPSMHSKKTELWWSWLLHVELQTLAPQTSMTHNSHTEDLHLIIVLRDMCMIHPWNLEHKGLRQTPPTPVLPQGFDPFEHSVLNWLLALLTVSLGSFSQGPYSTLFLPLFTLWDPLFPYY